MSVRFLHTSDWQIGMKGAGLGEAGALVAAQRIRSLEEIFRVAEDQKVRVILAAGDLFENNTVAEDDVAAVARIIGAHPEIEVHVIPGNHDLGGAGSVWRRLVLRELDNLKIHFDALPQRIDGWTLHPMPVRSKTQATDPCRELPDLRDADGVQVGMAHGHLTSVSFGGSHEDIVLPLDATEVERAGLDYLACGHWHGTRVFATADGVERIVYSGTHEQTHHRETDAGQVILVEIEDKGAAPKLTPLPVGKFRWTRQRLEFAGDDDLDRLREVLDEQQVEFLRLELSGELPRSLKDELAELIDEFAGKFHDLRVKDAQVVWTSSESAPDIDLDDPGITLVHQRLEESLDGAEGDEAAILEEAARHFRRYVAEEGT